jgi:hypothetical protein
MEDGGDGDHVVDVAVIVILAVIVLAAVMVVAVIVIVVVEVTSTHVPVSVFRQPCDVA